MSDIKYLTRQKVDALLAYCASKPRNGQRDALLVLLGYRHGTRISELLGLRWSNVDFEARVLRFSRLKGGKQATHPLQDDEVAALEAWRAAQWPVSDWIFTTTKGAQLKRRGVAYILERCGDKLGEHIHPHMLRHTCGHLLVDAERPIRGIQDYLGHQNINQTVLYTQTSEKQFAEFWK
jgi:integrase